MSLTAEVAVEEAYRDRLISDAEKSELLEHMHSMTPYNSAILEKLTRNQERALLTSRPVIKLNIKSLQCGICDETYSTVKTNCIPKVLTCGHTICSLCVLKVYLLPRSNQKCPFCQFALPTAKSSIPNNFSLLDLLQDLPMHDLNPTETIADVECVEPPIFRSGAKVKIRMVSDSELEALQRDHGGFNSAMLKMRGCSGTVHSIDSDGDLDIWVNGRSFHWNPRLVEHRGLQFGEIVTRGPHWTWEDQDGGPGSRGLVMGDIETTGWAEVQWDGGGAFRYRWGIDDCYDLRVLSEADLSRSTSFAVGSQVKIRVVSEAELIRLQTNHGGTADSMIRLMGKLGTVVGIDDDGDLQVKVDELTFTWAPAMIVAPEEGSTVLISVGAFVARGPDWEWNDQDGGVGSQGIVVSTAIVEGCDGWVRVQWPNGDENNYRWGFEDCHDLRLLTEEDLQASRVFVVGMTVKIRVVSQALLTTLQENHGGSNDTMLSLLGKIGTIVEVDSDGDVKVKVDGGCFTWAPAMVEVYTGELRPICVGDVVVRGPDWHWGDQDGGTASQGVVLNCSAAVGWVKVQWANGSENSYRWGEDGCYDICVLPETDIVQIATVQARVKIRQVTAEELTALQASHGGSNDEMLTLMGKVGTVVVIDDDGDVLVDIDGNVFLWSIHMLLAPCE